MPNIHTKVYTWEQLKVVQFYLHLNEQNDHNDYTHKIQLNK